jgi:hypothetical protein
MPTMSTAIELQASRPLHELLSLNVDDRGTGELRRLATLGVSGVDAQHASVLGRKVADWDTDAIKSHLREAFDVDPFVLMFKAWSQLRKVHQAARASAGPPAVERSVALARHEIELKLEPDLVLEVGGVDWCSIGLTLALKLSFESVQLTLHGGRLTGVRLGNPAGTVTLKCEGQEVAAFKRELKLHASYRFEPPLDWPVGGPSGQAQAGH